MNIELHLDKGRMGNSAIF
ncbi:Protein of unknown function [Bacillus cereus]|nr:Protein of unknown function [Bacillus cereus]SCN31158.1 Protein of unknown function [Bacillus wiedmannii]